MTILWPPLCPICSSRKIYIYAKTGDWFCSSCDVSSTDVADVPVADIPAEAKQ